MDSRNFVIIIIPVLLFVSILYRHYNEFDIINHKKEEIYETKTPEVLSCEIGHPIELVKIETKKKDEEKMNVDLISYNMKKNERVIPLNNKNLPGTKVSIHPSQFYSGTKGNYSWLMKRAPHLISSGHGQGY